MWWRMRLFVAKAFYCHGPGSQAAVTLGSMFIVKIAPLGGFGGVGWGGVGCGGAGWVGVGCEGFPGVSPVFLGSPGPSGCSFWPSFDLPDMPLIAQLVARWLQEQK